MRTPSANRLLMFASALLFATNAVSQQAVSYLNDPGSPAYATNIPVENGFINVSNGNLHLEIPLASIPQRGTMQLAQKITYDSRIWMFSPYGWSAYQWQPTNVHGAGIAPSSTSGGSLAAAGWQIVLGGYTSPAGFTSAPPEVYSNPCYDDNGDYLGEDDIYYYSLSVIDPSGAIHPTSATETMEEDLGCNYQWYTTYTYYGGTTYDGSGYTITVDSSNNVHVLDPSGNDILSRVDRYGNHMSSGAGYAYDTMDNTGRIPVIITQSGNTTYLDVLAPAGPLSSYGTRVRYTVTTTPMTVSTSFGQSGTYEWSGTLNPVTSIQLPNGSQYTFTYDSTYGELQSVTLPTGGTINYGYTNFTDSTGTMNRWASSHSKGSDPAETLTPSVVSSCSSGCQEAVTLHKPSGDESKYTFTVVNGSWNTQTAIYTGPVSSGTLLSQQTSTNGYSNPCTPATACPGLNYLTSSLTTTELLPTGSGSAIYTQTQTSFDSFTSKPTAIKLWDYMSSASTTTPPSSTPTRETDIAYTGSWGAPPYDLQTVKVLDSTGAQASLTTYGYTGSATATSGVTQHTGPVLTPQYLHTVTQWLNTGASPVTTYSMDDTGQVLSVQDPDGHSPATTTYQCSNSLPLHVTNSLGQQTTYSYDCSSGVILGVKDPNDLAASRAGTTYAYEATAGRLQSVSYPDGGSTGYVYYGSGSTYPYREVDTKVAETSSSIITTANVEDSYGRAWQTSSNGISDETSYDSNGRVSCVTNPHLSTSSPTDGSTCITSYDGFDRPLVQQQPDGTSTLQLTYTVDSTNLKTVTAATDEAGNQTQKSTNALGQLATVVESSPSGPLTTKYNYDGLGNLIKVNQLGNGTTDVARTRTFTYDSLSRLLCASNPENSSAPCPATATSSHTAGTVGYGYDADGNQTSLTDARGITVTNTYDALNRPLTKTASGINYQYTYDTLSGLPNQNSIGRLVYATNNSNAAAGLSYDAMGRLNWQTSWTPSTWSSGGNLDTASYDLAGNMTDFTYPDGHHIHQSFNSSGQLTQVNYADWWGTTVNYPYVSSVAYSPLGGMTSLALGNGVNESISYNNRAQPCEIAASYPATPGSSTMAFAYDKQYYFSSGGSGGVCGTVTGNNGNVWSIADARNSAHTQTFQFDSLNRLTSGARADNSFNYSYAIDSFGNMAQQNNLTTNPAISFTNNNQLQVAVSGYTYDAAGNLTDTGSSSGGHHYTFDSLGQQTQVDYGTTSTETYDALGHRIRKDLAGGDYIEYNLFGSQSMAETRHSLGTWEDDIYANGQLVARDHSADTYIQFSGTNSASGLYSLYYLNLPTGGIPIQSAIGSAHAKLVWRQEQSGAAVPKGGIGVVTAGGTNLNWTATDQDGQVINSDNTQNAWHNRVVDLNSIAGQTVSTMWVNEDVNTGAGAWTEQFADIAIVEPDGTTYTLYNNQTGQTFSGSSASGVSGQTFSENEVWNPYIPGDTTHYFLQDHLGSARMEFAGPGWPVWGEDYAPYGQEVSPTGSPEATSNIYKFTGYERDPETAIAAGAEEDYAQARYYSSAIQGRFTSPDPYAGSMHLDNPQTMNRYSYAMNNPVRFADPTGLDPCFNYDYDASYTSPVCVGNGGYGEDGSGGGNGGGNVGGGGGDPGSFTPYTPGQELDASYNQYAAEMQQMADQQRQEYINEYNQEHQPDISWLPDLPIEPTQLPFELAAAHLTDSPLPQLPDLVCNEWGCLPVTNKPLPKPQLSDEHCKKLEHWSEGDLSLGGLATVTAGRTGNPAAAGAAEVLIISGSLEGLAHTLLCK